MRLKDGYQRGLAYPWILIGLGAVGRQHFLLPAEEQTKTILSQGSRSPPRTYTPSSKEAFTPQPKEANSHQNLGEIFSSIPCILTVSRQHEYYP